MREIRAPFTFEQVLRLNQFQAGLKVLPGHPFTCGQRDGHRTIFLDHGVLIAAPDGWLCPECDYQQDWAHACMAVDVHAGYEVEQAAHDTIWARLAARQMPLLKRVKMAKDAYRECWLEKSVSFNKDALRAMLVSLNMIHFELLGGRFAGQLAVASIGDGWKPIPERFASGVAIDICCSASITNPLHDGFGLDKWIVSAKPTAEFCDSALQLSALGGAGVAYRRRPQPQNNRGG